MRIIITGLVGQYPFGGVIWDYLQYLLGFRSLGHQVLYLEDSGAWPYDPVAGTITDDCSFALQSLRRIFTDFDMAESWVYRNGADGKFHGAGEKVAREWLRHGDLLVNVSSAGWLRDYDLRVGHRMFIDGDPMFCQIGLLDGSNPLYAGRLRDHDSHFTFGLSVGQPDCPVPVDGITWRPTVQPVAIDQWPVTPVSADAPWTTVMNWASYKPKVWEGRTYGQKNLEFNRFRDLPSKTNIPLRLAMGLGVDGQRPAQELRQIGWDLVEPQEVVPDHRAYRSFLTNSRGEWSVAKHGYVKGRTGWFSCRTACYLAAGRPAVVQETGWSHHLPSDRGVLPFTTVEEAAEGLGKVTRNYSEHSKAAREIALEFFDAKKVCQGLLRQA
ncbi:hypothetical protein MCEMIH22_00944 [Candidatus Methylacidiphilaceae bacterium]